MRLDCDADQSRGLKEQLQFEMERFEEAPRAPARAQEKMRASLLCLVPLAKAFVNALEGQELFSVLDPFPGFSA